MSGGLRVLYRIAGSTRGPGEARQIVSQELGRFVGSGRLEDLKLLVTELLNGRVRQRRDDDVVLDLEAQDVIRCSIVDHGPASLPSECSMRILDLLATRWGVSRDHDATRVWFEADRGVASRA